MTKIDRKNVKVFLDMDGVLTDYMGSLVPTMNETIARVAASPNKYKERQPGLYKAVKKATQELEGDIDQGNPGSTIIPEFLDRTSPQLKKKSRSLMYTLVSNNRSWWARLNWMSGGREVWECVKDYRPIICTGPMGPNSKKGKTDWIKRELGRWSRPYCVYTYKTRRNP